MSPPGGLSETGIRLIAMACEHCGAPLSVPEGARSVDCAYCGARLEVCRFGGDGDRAKLNGEGINHRTTSVPPTPIVDRGRAAENRADGPIGWTVVASFKTVSEWHEAAHVLGRAGIVALMKDDPRDSSLIALAVPASQAQHARQLLSRPARGG